MALGIPAGRALGGPSVGGGAEGGTPAPLVVVVRPGDTLWGIAEDLVGPTGDPRPLVDAIARANGVDPGEIRLEPPFGTIIKDLVIASDWKGRGREDDD